MEITSLISLKPFKYSYRICVHICRTWRAIRYGAEDYNGLHCVTVDQQGVAIHGFLPEEQVEDMVERPEQGQMYEIHQFSTRQHAYGLQPVDNPVVVQFNGRTIFCKVAETVPPVPANSFRLVEFNKLNAEREAHAVPSSHAVLADIYDCIRSVRPPHPQFIKRQNKTGLKCEITLENLQFCKPGDKTKVLGDFHVFETTEPKNILTVQCLTGLNPTIYKARSVLCKGKIIKLGTNGWWYRRCPEPRCYKQCFKAENLDGKYACKAHGLQPAIPCFRLSTLIDDEVSDVTVTAMGNQAQQLIGCTLKALRKKRFYVSEQVIPPEITSLIGQIRVFELRGNAFGEWTVIGVGPSIKDNDITSTVNEPAVAVEPSIEDYDIGSPIDETAMAVSPSTENVYISSPETGSGTNSPTQLADLALQTPEKNCHQPKRTHSAIQKPLFSERKKNKDNTNTLPVSSSAMKGKNKVD